MRRSCCTGVFLRAVYFVAWLSARRQGYSQPNDARKHHVSQQIKDAIFMYGLLMEPMTGYSIAEFRM